MDGSFHREMTVSKIAIDTGVEISSQLYVHVVLNS